MVLSNRRLGIERRDRMANQNRSRSLAAEKLALVRDPYVAMSLRLQREFGLRREEAIKFTPKYAMRGGPDRAEVVVDEGRQAAGDRRPEGVAARGAARRGAAGERRGADRAGAQLRAAAERLRERVPGGGARRDARPAPRVGAGALRGADRDALSGSRGVSRGGIWPGTRRGGTPRRGG